MEAASSQAQALPRPQRPGGWAEDDEVVAVADSPEEEEQEDDEEEVGAPSPPSPPSPPPLYRATDDIRKYLPLYRAIVEANWEEAQIFLKQHPTAITSPLTCNSDTALHVCAQVPSGKGNNASSFVEKLVAMLGADEEEELALGQKNKFGNTPLDDAAIYGNIEVAKILVGRNTNLLYLHKEEGLFPIHAAALNRRKSKDVFLYFLSVTKDDAYAQPNPYAAPSGVSILVNLIGSNFYDLALMLIEKYPDLGCHKRVGNDISALTAITQSGCVIINKHSLNLWQSFIYSWLPWKSCEKMVMNHQALNLVKCLCDQLKTLDKKQVESLASEPTFLATILDNWQVFLNIVEAFPTAAYLEYSKDDKDHNNLLYVALENRSENVFNLVCGTTVLVSILSRSRDNTKDDNTILHLAGKLAPPHKLNLVSGAALQMQRELQWFKEVEKMVPSHYMSWENKDGKTPNVIFTEEHKKLKEGGEKWMKDTANSCSIAAALIVTVVFAAAITVPGGNDDKNGLPIFSNHNNNLAFTVFAVSNAASRFTSTTSLLVFLSILTSRYAEQDFLYALPKRLIIGLLTLFLSIIFMMVAFSSTVYLVFGNNRRGVVIIVAAFACLPVTSFVLLQFPLLVALVSSTYGPGIFDRRGIPQQLSLI